MSEAKQSRRKTATKKLEPIDWHEFANDAVLNGNMSTLYRRPPSEDPTAYASAEALVEIGKRVGSIQVAAPTVGTEPTVGPEPTAGRLPILVVPTVGSAPTVGAGPAAQIHEPTEGSLPTGGLNLTPGTAPTVGSVPTAGPFPTVGPVPTAPPSSRPTGGSQPTAGTPPTVGPPVGSWPGPKRRVKPIRVIQDALTLAGQVLYKAMYGSPDSGHSKSCTKGYRQLAAETHLDKDTVRDLISDFKDKGIVRETGTYDPDTRSSKTYEVLSERAILRTWRDAGITCVTTGRWRPMFCTAQGEPLTFRPTVGPAIRTDRAARDAGRAGQ